MVGHVDTGRVVDRVGVDPPALQRIGNAAALGDAEIGPLPHDLGAQRLGIDAHRVVGAVAGFPLAFGMGFEVGADAAEEQQIDFGRQHLADQLGRGQVVFADGEDALHLGADRDRFGDAVEDAAAGRDQGAVVIHPARPREAEQPLALGEAGRGVGVGIDEDVQVVEGAEEADVARLQHAVAEHVARHVADADNGEVLALDVAAEFAEVALDQLPGAARGDAHRLVVVAFRSARGESVAEPEAGFLGDAVSDVGEGCGALVGGDDEVWVVLVVADDGRRR